jgi:hypothetical protein
VKRKEKEERIWRGIEGGEISIMVWKRAEEEGEEPEGNEQPSRMQTSG